MYTGTLKNCLKQAAYLHAQALCETIAIVKYPRSKTFKVYTEKELKETQETEKDHGQYIALCVTASELTLITRSDQYSLFPDSANGN